LSAITVKAIVPGSIYSDLRRNDVLKEDLYYENNYINYRWVSRENRTFHTAITFFQKHFFKYRRRFSIEQKLSLFLLAEGINRVSCIYINDKMIGTTGEYGFMGLRGFQTLHPQV
jgi:hypothetical protein